MEKTIALVCCVGEYTSRDYVELFAPLRDGERIRRMLTYWGVSDENIIVLRNSDVTRENVIATIGKRVRIEKPDRFLLFYGGHGDRIETESGVYQSYLVPGDCSRADLSSRGLELIRLVDEIRKLKARETHLFLDACAMRIDSLKDPIPKTEGDNYEGFFYCMLGAGVEEAYEDRRTYEGFFTKSVLQSLTVVGGVEPDHGRFTTKVNETIDRMDSELAIFLETITSRRNSSDNDKISDDSCGDSREDKARLLARPYVYGVGNKDGWPLPQSPEGGHRKEYTDNGMVERTDGLRKLHAERLLNDSRGTWLTGDMGIGKTQLILQYQRIHGRCIYITLRNHNDGIKPETNDLSALDKSINRQIQNAARHLFKDESTRPAKLLRTLRLLNLDRYGWLVVIDHFHELKVENQRRFLREICPELNMCLFVSNTTPPRGEGMDEVREKLQQVTCPSISKQELYRYFLAVNGGDETNAESQSERFKENLKGFLQHRNRDGDDTAILSPEVQRIIRAVIASEGFFSYERFREIFGLDKDALDSLRNQNVLLKQDELYSLDKVFLEKEDEDRRNAVRYWALEWEDVKTFEVSHDRRRRTERRFLRAWVKCPSTADVQEILESSIQNAFHEKDDVLITQVTEAIQKHAITDDFVLQLAKNLCHYQRADQIGRFEDLILMLEENIEDPERLNRVMNIHAEWCWWHDRTEEALTVSEKVLSRTEDPLTRAWAMMNKGQVYIMSSRWHEAIEILEQAPEFETMHARDRNLEGWFNMILSCALQYLGIRPDEADKRFQQAVQAFRDEGNMLGVMVAHNNFGEVLWRNRRYERAEQVLKAGIGYCETLENYPTWIDSLKSLIQIELRTQEIMPARVNEYIDEGLRMIEEHQTPAIVDAQFWLTYALVQTYRDDIDEAREFTEKAEPLVRSIPDFLSNVYANYANAYLLEGNSSSAALEIEKAFLEAKKAKSYLAFKIMLDDFAVFLDRSGKRLSDDAAKRKLIELRALVEENHEVVLVDISPDEKAGVGHVNSETNVELSFEVVVDSDEEVAVFSEELRNSILAVDGVDLREEEDKEGSGLVAGRMGGLELIGVAVTSYAAGKLAEAVIEWVKRRKVKIRVTKKDGTKIEIDAQNVDDFSSLSGI